MIKNNLSLSVTKTSTFGGRTLTGGWPKGLHWGTILRITAALFSLKTEPISKIVCHNNPLDPKWSENRVQVEESQSLPSRNNSCTCDFHGWRWRWIPQTNQERDALIGQKLAGRGLEWKGSHTYSVQVCSQPKLIFFQRISITVSWWTATEFKINYTQIIALKSYLQHL